MADNVQTPVVTPPANQPPPDPVPPTPAPNAPIEAKPGEKVADGQQTNGHQPEPKPPEKPPEKEPESRRFAALARQSKQIREAQEKLKAEREAFARERAEIDAYRKAKEAAKLDPLAFLEQIGLSYNDLTGAVLNNGKPTPDLHVKALEDKLEAFRKEQEQARQAQIEAQQRTVAEEEQALRANWLSGIEKLVHDNPADLEYLNTYGDWITQIPLVVEEYYQTNGKLLSDREAADIVEKHLEGLVEQAARTKKWQAKAKPQPQGDVKRIEQAQRTTLTNSMTASTNALGEAKTEAERKARAIAAYRASAKQ